MHEFISLAAASVVSLLPIANPFSTMPIFLSLTKRMTQKESNRIAKRTCIYVVVILVVFFIAGRAIMEFFGISIPGLRIAGGLMIMRLSLSMLSGTLSEEQTQDQSGKPKSDIAFMPLAMPGLSGPGTIAATIGLASKVDTPLEYPAVIVGILTLAVVSYFVLRSSGYLMKILGDAGMKVILNVMGFLILCIGVQFVVDGVVEIIRSLN